jgi:hypothetical protein
MSLPKTNAVIPELRAILARFPRGVAPRELYEPLAARMGLTEADLEQKVSDGKRSRWENRVQAARQRLVEAGELSKKARGVWRLTPKGKRHARGSVAESGDTEALRALMKSRAVRPTERLQLVLARLGQGDFRSSLLERDAKCALCRLDSAELLIASHIKPWRDATDEERLDPDNGLLLCPNSDRLFDTGYISFAEDGSLLVSDRLSKRGRALICSREAAIEVRAGRREEYLSHHRTRVFE